MSEEKKINEVKTSEAKAEKKAKKPAKEKKKGGLKAFLTSRKARHGSVAMAIVAVVIAIVIVLNVVCALLIERFPDLKIDFTANKSFALQQDTIDYVSHLDKEVTVNVLTTESDFKASGTYFVQALNLLEKMESNSNGKVKIKFVDLTENPTFTTQFSDIDWENSNNKYVVLVECGDQHRALTLEECFVYDQSVVEYYGYQFTGTTIEQAVVTAMFNVTTDDKIVVDIVTGNQEQDYTGIKELLENNAYKVNEISFVTQDIDKDAEFVILYAPGVDLDEKAAEKVKKWLDNDGKYGKTLVYIPTTQNVDTPNIDSILKDYGMEISDGYVYETNPECLVSGSTPYAFLTTYTEHYVDKLKNANIPVVVSDSREVVVTDSATAHPILTTSNMAGVQPFEPDEEWTYMDNVKGEPVNVAAEGVKTNSEEKTSNVVVFGSYHMFDKEIMSYHSFNNSAYFMNVINTSAGKDDATITIETKSLDSAELGVTDMSTTNMILVIFVIVIPVSILVMGIIVWLRRRNR